MRLLKGELGYLWAALLEVIRFRSFHGELEIDNQAQGGKIVMISVMNGPYAGGGFHLAPGARADDGKINVVTIGDYPRISRFPVLLKTRKGTHPGLKRVQMRLAATVRIQTDRPVPVHMDGELLPMMSELSIEVCPRAIRVIS
jgi:diacylglycerol kinase family enzyme